MQCACPLITQCEIVSITTVENYALFDFTVDALLEKKKSVVQKSCSPRFKAIARDSIELILKRRLLSKLKQRRCSLNGQVLSYLHARPRMALTASRF